MRPFTSPQKKSMKMAWMWKYPKAEKMASSRHTTAPTSRRMGRGAGAFFRLPPEREAVPERPEAARLPPVVFFCVVAMRSNPFRGDCQRQGEDGDTAYGGLLPPPHRGWRR